MKLSKFCFQFCKGSISILASVSSCKLSSSVAEDAAAFGIGDGFKANSEPATLSMSASGCSCCSIGAGVALLALEWEGVGEGDRERGRGSSCGVGDGVGVRTISEAGSTVVSC